MSDFLVRLVSSADHNCSVDELVSLIKTHGTDRYDDTKKQISNEFYKKFEVDFFAETSNQTDVDKKISEMKKSFPRKSAGDRSLPVVPDVAIIYDSSKCQMIQNVYPGNSDSDCYKFRTSPLDALIEVKAIYAS